MGNKMLCINLGRISGRAQYWALNQQGAGWRQNVAIYMPFLKGRS